MRSIWVVDDDQSIRWVLEKAVTRQGYACRTFEMVKDVFIALETDLPSVLISDIRMPGKSGLELLQYVREQHPNLPVIIMTAYSDLESAVSAFQGGAFEYLPKPFDVNKAVELIHRAMSEAPKETVVDEPTEETPEILGQAPAMQDVFRAIGRLSQSNVTVLITGESGSGKELVARALHKHSPRASQPFIALNTAAIPKDLLESELFGHERGSFTGAAAQRRGRFEQAEGGTLFLDEIGDMPSELQTRLLRVLSDGHYYRVGGHQPIKANVRVIAATHQNLEERVRQGLFREDLYHRLNVIRLRLPALRERREDIPLLARYFLMRSAKDLGVDPKRLSEPVVQAITQMPLPGNVRQLENLCRWLTVMAPSQTVQLHDLPPEVLENLPVAVLSVSPTVDDLSDTAQALHRSGGSMTLGAGIARGASLAPAVALPEDAVGLHGSVEPSAPLLSSSDTERYGEVYSLSGAGDYQQASVHGSDMNQQHTAASFQAPACAAEEKTWMELLERVAEKSLLGGAAKIMDQLTAEFESTLIKTALRFTNGRRIEAAQKLGIGRNTITRKIQELGIQAQPSD